MKNRFLIICTVLFLSSCLAYGQEQASVTNDFSENKQGCIQHPWQGKKVGYIGDSITDPNCYGDNIKKYWDFLKEWLGITGGKAEERTWLRSRCYPGFYGDKRL